MHCISKIGPISGIVYSHACLRKLSSSWLTGFNVNPFGRGELLNLSISPRIW